MITTDQLHELALLQGHLDAMNRIGRWDWWDATSSLGLMLGDLRVQIRIEDGKLELHQIGGW